MGIVNYLLGEATLHNQKVDIELNLGEEIHLEFDNFRIAMSKEDFVNFSRMLLQSREKFFAIKGEVNAELQ